MPLPTQESNQVDLVNSASKDEETLPLVGTNRKVSVARKNKYKYLRYLARVAAVFNDSIGGYLSANLIALMFLFPDSYVTQNRTIFNTVLLGNPLLFVVLSGLNEIKTSYNVSYQSEFLIGNSDFEHIQLFMIRLKEILGEVNGNEHENLKQLEATLKAHEKYEESKALISDFRAVSRYNFIRAQANDFNNYLMTTNILFVVFLLKNYPESNIESGWEILFQALGITTPIWLLKIFPDIMERNWSRYENKWQSLPSSLKKCIIILRKLMDFLFNFSFSYGTELIAVGELFKNSYNLSFMLPPTQVLFDILHSFWFILGSEYGSVVLTLFPALAILYPLTQLLPDIAPDWIGNIAKDVKRVVYSLFHGTYTTSFLFILLMQLFCFSNEVADAPMSYMTFSIIFASGIGILIAANNMLNYGPATGKLNTGTNNTTLRELENAVDADLSQETLNNNLPVKSQTAQNSSQNKSRLFSFWKQPSVNIVDVEATEASIGKDAENKDEITNQVDLMNSAYNVEILPLLGRSRKLSVERKNKYAYLRYFARFATVINDSVNGYLSANLIALMIYFPGSYVVQNRMIFNTVILGNPLLFLVLSSLNEIKTSYSLSSESEFIMGSSDFEHIRLFMARLEEVLGEVRGNEYENLKQLESALKTHEKYKVVKILINDFRLVSRYNFIRHHVDDFSNYLMITNIVFGIFYFKYYHKLDLEPGWKMLLKVLGITSPIWLLKIFPDIMEKNWPRYENKWQRLPSLLKKCIIALRKLIRFLFNLSFSYGIEIVGLELLEVLSYPYIFSATPIEVLTWALGYFDFVILNSGNADEILAFVALFSSFPILYSLSQFLPYFKPGHMGMISKNVRRGVYSLFHGVRTTSLLLILLMQLFCYDNDSRYSGAMNYVTFSIIFASSIGLLIAANDMLNYRPAAEKMNMNTNAILRNLGNTVVADLDEETMNVSQSVNSQTSQNNSQSKSKLFSFWKQHSISTARTEAVSATIRENAESKEEIADVVSTELGQ